jgi:acetylcholinesterase
MIPHQSSRIRYVIYLRALDCRNVAVADKSFEQSVALAWQPRVDGVFLTHSPQKLVLDGKVADIPFVTGDCDDEGTMFALPSLNIT